MPFGWFKVMMIMFASCLMNMSIILCFWLLIVFSDLNFFVASFHLGVLFGKGVLWCGFPRHFRSKPQQRVHFWNCCMSPALRCWGSGEPGPLAQTSQMDALSGPMSLRQGWSEPWSKTAIAPRRWYSKIEVSVERVGDFSMPNRRRFGSLVKKAICHQDFLQFCTVWTPWSYSFSSHSRNMFLAPWPL